MLCEKCKIREATIQYTEVVNGNREEHHFCAQCAREMDFGQVSALFDGEFTFGKIISALLGEEGQADEPAFTQIVCPNCGTSYQQFVDESRFGCADCYEVFDLLIRDSIQKLQGSETHKGKHPKYSTKMIPESLTRDLPGASKRAAEQEETGTKPESGRAAELNELRVSLRQAIRDEEFELAAQYRDRIRELEKEDADA